MYRLAGLLLSLLFALLTGASASAQTPTVRVLAPANPVSPTITSIARKAPAETLAPGRLVVVYRGGVLPRSTDAITAHVATAAVTHLAQLGLSTMQVVGDINLAIAQLRAQPEVETVLQDRIVQAHHLELSAIKLPTPLAVKLPNPAISPIAPSPVAGRISISGADPLGTVTSSLAMPSATVSTGDLFYNSPQGWAILKAGGYGNNIVGGPNAGPWTTSLGAGVRIAVLDTGVDPNHPDISPNLALNLSEVDQTAYPSLCDDGSPVDQAGHGTWVASLAAGAVGPTTGEVIGLAPQATLLNIKVMQRMPSAIGATQQTQCAAGSGGGLLSWVLAGLNDAIANHADIVTLSLGTLVDLTTGDGAGWKAQFDAATYAAQQSGIVIVAALGNDGLDLSSGRYAELPAMARGVLPVTASTNPACAENQTPGATCAPGPVARASYSNHGVAAAIAAPGGNLPEGPDYALSGFVRGACASGLLHTADGLPATGGSFGCFGLGHVAYAQAMGTSAAAPLVAGAAALLHAAHSDWSAAQTIAALQSTATKQDSMTEPTLNLAAAMSMR